MARAALTSVRLANNIRPKIEKDRPFFSRFLHGCYEPMHVKYRFWIFRRSIDELNRHRVEIDRKAANSRSFC